MTKLVDKSNDKLNNVGKKSWLKHEAKIKSIMDAQCEHYSHMKTELEKKISEVEAKCSAKRYCVNRRTGCAHRILNAFEEQGHEAVTYCGWKYTLASIKMCGAPEEDCKDVCPTCLPELKRRAPRKR